MSTSEGFGDPFVKIQALGSERNAYYLTIRGSLWVGCCWLSGEPTGWNVCLLLSPPFLDYLGATAVWGLSLLLKQIRCSTLARTSNFGDVAASTLRLLACAGILSFHCIVGFLSWGPVGWACSQTLACGVCCGSKWSRGAGSGSAVATNLCAAQVDHSNLKSSLHF